MKNDNVSVKSIFLKKMALSSLLQLLIFCLIVFSLKFYFYRIQMKEIFNNLFIQDAFISAEIARYALLNDEYALNLEMYNLENERKLDSIIYSKKLINIRSLGKCDKKNSEGYQFCIRGNNFTAISPIVYNHKTLGYVVTNKKFNSITLYPANKIFLTLFVIIVGIFGFNFLFLFFMMKRKIENNTKYLIEYISDPVGLDANDKKIDITEYRVIAKRFSEKYKKIEELQNEKSYFQAKKNIAEQVAHDIRSPLAAINIALSNVQAIPEKKRLIVKNATKRINEIANNLLIQSKNSSSQRLDEFNLPVMQELIYVALDQIVSEKRYEYANTKIDIRLDITESSFHCFSKLNISSFKRIISNLINNSIEAMDNSGVVSIKLLRNESLLEIIIEDNGAGIPQELIAKVAERGFSFNKKSGSGFGLSYAKEYIEGVNGNFDITSKVNEGTKIIISLPISSTPLWFSEMININQNADFVIVDDESTMYDVWSEKLLKYKDLKLVYLKSAFSLIEYLKNKTGESVYFVDYDLSESMNGLDLIEKMNLQCDSFLVTSNFEDEKIRQRCESIGVKIIPKPLIAHLIITSSCN